MRGLAAMAAALAVAFAVGALFPKAAYPPARLASIIVTITPGDFATRMIETLGHNALRGLSIGVNIGLLMLGGAYALRIERGTTPSSRATRALVGGVVMFIAAMILSLTSAEGSSSLAVVTYLASSYFYARYALGRPLADALQPAPVEGSEMPLDAIRRSRRRFIVRGATIAGVVLVGGVTALKRFGREALESLRIVDAAKPFVHPPDDPDFPQVAGLSREITDNASFYNVDINIVKPSVDVDRWRLKIHGLVGSPYELDYQSLQNDFEVVELAHTLTCISNEVGGDLISTAVWRGVRLSDVLQRAGLKDSIVDIVFRASEGYSDSIPFQKAMEETTLVVFGMNGVALPREHGFPARIIVPGIYGMKNVKWLTEIEAVDHDYQGYWMVRGWSDEAIIKTQSRIDVPFDTAEVKAGAHLAGVAWAGDRGIDRVEVSDDGGTTWQAAVLKRPLSPVAWRLWVAEITQGAGKRKVVVRATDGAGEVQTTRRTKPHPDGSSGLDSVVFTVK